MKVSIVIPTFNSEKVLAECLRSIDEQHYPKEKIEIIVVDGGSQDRTVDIAREYTEKIYDNPLKTGEAGKAVGLKNASGDIVAFIDSDNILPEPNWLSKMVLPFHNEFILASEPLFYTHRSKDHFITRYSALIGMNDPLCHFLGNYDRWNELTQKWTEIDVISNDKGSYYEISFKNSITPTIGANGFLIRKAAADSLSLVDYFVDIDILPLLIQKSGIQQVKIAKVKCGIVHLYCQSIAQFSRKQKRRVCDYLYFSHKKKREYEWSQTSQIGIIKFIFSTICIFPLLFQTMKGFLRKKDSAWLFHPIACVLTLWIYSTQVLKAKFFRPTLYAR